MRNGPVLDEFLKEVEKELMGVDSKTIIEEISGHIRDKAEDMAADRGLRSADDDIYREIISGMGDPREVVKPYLREMPVKLPISVKAFLAFQFLTALAAFLVFVEGMDTLLWALDQTPDDTGFILTQVASNTFFLLISLLLMGLVIMQWKRPVKIPLLGSFSVLVSVSVMISIIFVMLRVIVWNHWGVEYGENTYYPLAGAVMVGLLVIYILGLQQIGSFQRRIDISEEDTLSSLRSRKRTRTFVYLVSSVFVILLILVAMGQSVYSEDYYESHELVQTQDIGGPNDARLELWEHHDENGWYETRKIVYHVEGEEIGGAFFPEMQRSLEWIRDGTENSSRIMAWWDYGHSIRGYTGRDVVLDAPIWSMSYTVADPDSVQEWEVDENRFVNVARALVTTELNFTSEIMELYDAEYILTNYRDAAGINYALIQAAYQPDPLSSYWPTLDENSFLYRVWNGGEIEGFEVVYSDLEVRILKKL
ncbi:MAG: HAAS signaling domain-containing protein [Thermoplasmatota archaeon]